MQCKINKSEFCRQKNNRVAVPYFIVIRGYGVAIHNPSTRHMLLKCVNQFEILAEDVFCCPINNIFNYSY